MVMLGSSVGRELCSSYFWVNNQTETYTQIIWPIRYLNYVLGGTKHTTKKSDS